MYSLLVSYIKSRKTPLIYSTIINVEDNTWRIKSSSGNVKKLFVCNHEETNTRIICHSSLQGTPNVVIIASDSDIRMFLAMHMCTG